jgi:uncharacterized membrane protein YphA (DoxX/SURF4 family)
MNTANVAVASNSKGLNIGLWIVQGLLALAFAMAGSMKLSTPYADLVQKMAWARHTPEALVKFIGVMEVAGALGVILPAATRIMPFLTPLAATGFAVIMILGGALHLSLGEAPIADVILCGLAAFVAWGRFRKAPITPRG